MNRLQKRRLYYVFFSAIVIVFACGLILFALKKNINVFLTPSELISQSINPDYSLNLGGMVKKNSVHHEKHTLTLHFIVTDFKNEVPVTFTGTLPDLFKENSGVIVTGKWLPSHVFMASSVLAKHDEKYMPANMMNKMKKI